MPIPKHLRHLYRGPEYRAFVTALLDRAGTACEQCHAPHRSRVYRVSLKQFAGWWWSETGTAHDLQGNVWEHLSPFFMMENFPSFEWRAVKIVVGPAHLNHTPGDFDIDHSKALCQWCHLNYDLPMHVVHSRNTRCLKKDAERPLLEATA